MTTQTKVAVRLSARGALRAVLLAAAGGVLAFAAAHVAPASSTSDLISRIASVNGESTTALSDGRVLILGGENDRGTVLATGWLQDANGVRTPLASRLRHARAWHTATVLPDGRVLVVGGIGRDGMLVRRAERIDPATGLVSPSATRFAPRAGHSATLLTDGRLLVAGGIGADGRALAGLELWDVAAQARSAVPFATLAAARYGQTAALTAEGTVLLWGGFGADGQTLTDGALVDAATQVATAIEHEMETSRPPGRLESSVSQDGATDVPVDRPLGIRFSAPLRLGSLSDNAVVLDGPEGVVARAAVLAEGGRLLFVTPRRALAPRTTYVLTLIDLRDDAGAVVPTITIQFTTAAPPGSTSGNDTAVAEHGSTLKAQPANHIGREGQAASLSGTAVQASNPAPTPAPLEAPPGVTAMSGRVLQTSGKPLAGVTLQSDDHVTTSDADGLFLLTGLACAPRCALLIDGTTAHRPGHTYGVFDLGFGVVVGNTTVLPFPLWMPELDTKHAIDIPSPTTKEVVLRNPSIPGLEVHLPPGTVIHDRQGAVVTRVTMTAIPNNRPPMPLPPWYEVPLVFTLQPGGAHIDTPAGTGAWIVYPNSDHLRPRQRVKYTTYEPQRKDWFVYGLGRVTDDGTQIVPDPGATFDTFRCSTQNPGDIPPDSAPMCVGQAMCIEPSVGSAPSDGDPVDLATGLFSLAKTDLVINDVIPIAVTRSYDTEDAGFYHFGVGMEHAYEMYLFSARQYAEVDLIRPEGSRVHYVRISSGDGFADAVFENENDPTAFYKSRIVWNGRGWDLTLRDGTAYVFGVNAHLLAIRDRNGNQVTISRLNDTFGRITRVTSPSGRFIDFTYNSAPHPVITQVTDNIGRTVSYTYDGSGHLQTVSGPDPMYSITYSYGQASPTGLLRMIKIKDAKQIIFLENTFDLASGHVLLQKQANTGTYSFAYAFDGQGQITTTTVTDPRGVKRQITFDGNGRVTSVTRAHGLPEAQTTAYARDPASELVTTIQDARGRVTTLTYDALGNVLTTTRLTGTLDQARTTLTHDPFGLVHTRTDPLNHTITFTHDTHGNLTAMTDPLGHTTTMAYDTTGFLVSRTDAMQNQTRYVRHNGDLVAIVDPLGNTERRLVDGIGRTVEITDALGRTRHVVYDPADRLSATTDALGHTIGYEYDPNRDLTGITDARQHVTTYTVGNMEQITDITNPLTFTTSYNYDLGENITTMTDALHKHNDVQYDGLGRRTFVGITRSGTTPPFGYQNIVQYTYDTGNRLIEVDDSDYGTIARTYDEHDRLTSEAQCVSDFPPCPDRTVSYVYDPAGRRTQLSVPNVDTLTYTWDEADRLTVISGSTSTVEFVYDDANRRTETRIRPNGATSGNRMVYGYDADSRVTSIQYYRASGSTGWVPLGDLTYGYDAVGNRTTTGGSYARTGVPSPFASASYDAANEISGVDGTPFSYDADGRLVSDVVRTYTWNGRGQLVSITASGVAADFRYDPFGRRIQSDINGAIVQYLYDGENPIVEFPFPGPARFMVTGLDIDEYFIRHDENGFNTMLSDALRSTIALADTSGVVRTSYTYDPFGGTTVTGRSSSNPIQYAGRENDGTSLYYNRTRYYSPGVARFISADPLSIVPGARELLSYVLASEANTGTYVDDSPIEYADPLGLHPLADPRTGNLIPHRDLPTDDGGPPDAIVDETCDGFGNCPPPHHLDISQVPQLIDDLCGFLGPECPSSFIPNLDTVPNLIGSPPASAGEPPAPGGRKG